MARKSKEEAQRTREQIIEAARAVFHQHGVARSSLEQVASAAGLTRGAVYWHFKDKAELFLAVRADVFTPLGERVDTHLFSDRYADPLDAIEAGLKEFFRVIEQCPTVRQVLEIMKLRCEFTEEFAEVQTEAERPGVEFMNKLEQVYAKAAAYGSLPGELEPANMALDTWLFVGGLLNTQLAHSCGKLCADIDSVIVHHMALRRRHNPA